MRRTDRLLILFFGLCCANLFFEFQFSKLGIFCTKPFLMIILSAWFYLKTKDNFTAFHKFLLAGFIFSMFGDTFLMFVENKPARPEFFLYGLGSFLVTHIFYLLAFLKFPSTKKGLIQRKSFWVLPFILLFFGNILTLWSGIPTPMKIPVVVYSLAIVLMAISALNLQGKVSENIFKWIFIGAILFVISDSLIGLNKFRSDDFQIPLVRILIMSFYLSGQYLLAKGGSLVKTRL
ncbi:MAG: putative membrane protein YhhN [Saprospiraceae bacterium]|jgi:uncharacterized membrane protein YhhN